MQSFRNHRKGRIIAASILVLATGLAPSLGAQAAPLSVKDAVTRALEKNLSVQSSSWDWLSASANADAARWRMMPSLSLSAGYQRLSDLGAESLQMANPFYPLGPSQIDFAFPASLSNYWALAVNTQYQVFAGFRIREAATLAQLQAESKLVGMEMVKRSLMFEVRRAYWEAVRATSNRQTLQKNLELMKSSSQLASQQFAQGIATKADLLAAAARYSQADLDLGDAVARQNRAYLTLASLIGNPSIGLSPSPQSADAPPPFTLTSQPGDPAESGFGQSLEENDLVAEALSRRPETRMTSLSMEMAEHGIKQAQAGLYPTVTLTGNYTYADPNQRVPFQTDPTIFTGTWAIGVQIGYDIGGVGTNLAAVKAQEQALKKTQADGDKQRNTVTLDVRTCIISLEQARRDVALTQGAVDQATEDVRVAQQRLASGTANDLEVLTAQFNLLRANFSVTNREIDAQIASADLARATALDEVK
ncbi:MAG: TolC family protein [Spirochaetia bacterium]|jgi:outer membrane protein TolC